MPSRLIAITTTIVLLPAARAGAYIESPMPLGEILDKASTVLVGEIQAVDAERRTIVASMARSLKGEKEYTLVQMNFNVGDGRQADYILALFETGDPFILYYERQGSRNASVGHVAGTWFQLFANHHGDDKRVWWDFTHMEIYLGRTFNGTTPELIQVTRDVLAGRRDPPAIDPRVPKVDVRRLTPQLARSRRAAKGRGGSGREGAAVATTTVITSGSRWRWRKGTAEASGDERHDAWRSVSFDDSSWSSGNAPFGYGDGPFGTQLDDMMQADSRKGYTTIFLRRLFTVADPKSVVSLECRVNYDDGFILWLNRHDALSKNGPAGSPGFDAVASGNHESGSFESYSLDGSLDRLVPGENVIAVQVFNRDLTSSDLKFDLELDVGVREPTANLSGGRSRQGSGRFVSIATVPAGGGEVRGVSWIDVDGNEFPDAYFCRGAGNLLLLGDGEEFEDASKRYGAGDGSRSASWADFDGDDHADLVTNEFLLLAGRGGRLRAVNDALKRPAATNPEGAGWIDFNGDGRPDVLITNGEHGIVLFENTVRRGEEPTFRDVSEKAGLGPGGLGKGNGDFIAFADYDGDGYTDFLYNLGDGVLAHNEGDGTFRVDGGSGITLPGGSAYKRGVAFADYDNDGDLDLFVPAAARPRLYRNENDGTFRDVTEKSGDLATVRQSFSSAWGDINHDGFLDLFVCTATGRSRMYLGDGSGRFRDLTEPAGLDVVGAAFGAGLADIDDDGDLDLAVNRPSDVMVLRNEFPKMEGHAPLRVRIRARKGAVGSVVRVLDARGRSLGFREWTGASGCGGQTSPVAHFAVPVGACTVSVVLSDGRVAQKKFDVATNGAVTTFEDGEFE